MKRLVIAYLLTVGLGYAAHAADADMYEPRLYEPTTLVPATPVYWNWSGFYAGGQIGMASATFDPGKATNSMVAHILRVTTMEAEGHVSTWSQLPNTSTQGHSYGAFVGFNSQWEDVIIGLELQYNRGKLSGRSSDAIGRSFVASDGYLYDVVVASQASAELKDYGALRGRAGYVMGRWLPYAQVGFVAGRANLFRSVTVAATGTDVTHTPPFPNTALPPTTMTERKNDAFMYGFSAGAGLDVGITQNIFLRAEYEYVQFFPTSGIKLSINTGRLGVAVKF